MFLASKAAWAGIVFMLLTTGVSGPRSTPASVATLSEAGSTFGHENDVKKMQESLGNNGHYGGKIDGVLGLRTRASIRSYQKTKNLPITGQVDAQTADGLGVRPESNWGNSAGREIGHSSDRLGDEIKRDKPSAGIRRTQGRASKTWRKQLPGPTVVEDERTDAANKQQAKSKKHS
jgi:peptidoglycan hydrolase-like protein with peptidoglycan-binding domain